MKVQVRKNGGSMILILPKPFVKYHELEEGDWVDISDIVKQ